MASPSLALSVAALGLICGALTPALAQDAPPSGMTPLVGELLPTGQRLTPQAMPGSKLDSLNPNLPGLPDFTAGQASAMALSPDGTTLLVLTSGYNRNVGPDGKPIPELSTEYVFVYDVSGPLPVKRQVVQVPNTFLGIAWAPDGSRFFVSGGVDDVVYDYMFSQGKFGLAGTIALGHKAGIGVDGTKPEAAGLAVSPDGKRLLVANYQNESVSLIDTAGHKVVAEADLRPGVIDPAKSGRPGGTYPNLVAFVSDGKAYAASQRDRELIALEVGPTGIAITGRQSVDGQPSAIILNRQRSRAYVALDNTDRVVSVDTGTDKVIEEIPATAPAEVWLNPEGLYGANTNGLALSGDGLTLIATNGGINAAAVIELGEGSLDPETAETAKDARAKLDDDGDEVEEEGKLPEASRVIGLLPTGWYPTSVAVRPDDARIYIANGKSNAGPNPLACRNTLAPEKAALNPCKQADQYVWQLEKAGLLTLPTPKPRQLAEMTWQVAVNNNFPSVAGHGSRSETMAFVRSRIDHVIYVVKENRTYDQVLGDLPVGNGDPSLTLLPQPITPNHHALALDFVTLDNFRDSGESSNTGWNWTTAARTTDFTERTAPVNYAGRGLQYDWEGLNRGVNVGLAGQDEREEANPATPHDPNVLAGTADVAAPDAQEAADAGEAGTGYLWDAALRAGLTVRNYGFYSDGSRYEPTHPNALSAELRDPFGSQTQVFFPDKPSLAPHSDLYFRGYDQKFPDAYRVDEWEREFDGFVQSGKLPNLTLLRVSHDHFGDFDKAVDGVNTVETQMADNDYAVGRIVAKVAASPFARSTLIFVIEDDAQDGADHVDAHRSIALIAGPYVRRHAVVSEHYTTVSLLKTIEAVLGLPALGLNDGLAEPMAEVFDTHAADWTYQAVVPEVLRSTRLPLPPRGPQKADAGDCFTQPARTAAYWQEAMKGQDFEEEDHLDTARFNAALWHGFKGDGAPLPGRSGADLSKGRETLLATFRRENGCRE
ncbi:bifunctional YncE family protein/alkaline phosphatase family protein [Mycobacterium sp. KBS0706]|uniref:bifunctional YncE family protein/alkaline phosphatase family protein n=1 Tax=Mycobacterium sp. KBS0706 TaxID=2578109 RepID=UPI00110F9627|nr:bifunctional YncE family protein/alkaline phosphatase family protein [Mycobacterium sp. KBS0706]TSD86920.1 bifunctional YncE family protein/alkaline phosphatase family protein [Mycobacterium sp. KBS0706]